jgi:hypothetical protein
MHLLKHTVLVAISFVLVGCQGTFKYKAPITSLKPTGPSIAVLPIVDSRVDRSIDKGLRPGYFFEMQQAIADELRSMNCFSEVLLLGAVSESLPDLILTPELLVLDLDITNTDEQRRQTAAMAGAFGAAGGMYYLAMPTDVLAYCKLGVRVETTTTPKRVFARQYNGAAYKETAKLTTGFGRSKARSASIALQSTMQKVKAELEPQVRDYRRPAAGVY